LEGERLKRERLEREEQQRIWEEERRIAQEERQRKEIEIVKFNELLQQANQWQQAQILRHYITAVEANAIQTGTLNDVLIGWLSWAKQRADLYDPLGDKIDNIFDLSL
jgi:hypothetical protein